MNNKNLATEKKETLTKAELMPGAGGYKDINYLLPTGSILTVVISYKYNSNIQQKGKKFFILRYFVESAPSN